MTIIYVEDVLPAQNVEIKRGYGLKVKDKIYSMLKLYQQSTQVNENGAFQVPFIESELDIIYYILFFKKIIMGNCFMVINNGFHCALYRII